MKKFNKKQKYALLAVTAAIALSHSNDIIAVSGKDSASAPSAAAGSSGLVASRVALFSGDKVPQAQRKPSASTSVAVPVGAVADKIAYFQGGQAGKTQSPAQKLAANAEISAQNLQRMNQQLKQLKSDWEWLHDSEKLEANRKLADKNTNIQSMLDQMQLLIGQVTRSGKTDYFLDAASSVKRFDAYYLAVKSALGL